MQELGNLFSKRVHSLFFFPRDAFQIPDMHRHYRDIYQIPSSRIHYRRSYPLAWNDERLPALSLLSGPISIQIPAKFSRNNGVCSLLARATIRFVAPPFAARLRAVAARSVIFNGVSKSVTSRQARVKRRCVLSGRAASFRCVTTRFSRSIGM